MNADERVQGVHLVGSVPLGSSEEVFRSCASALGGRLRRLPDGETGERSNWIRWQGRFLAETPGLEPAQPTPEGYGSGMRWRFRIREGVQPEEVRLGPLGYADAALASYREFVRLQNEGTIPSGVRFQVSLPTPGAVLSAFIRTEDCPVLEAAYERQMLQELDQIQRTYSANPLDPSPCPAHPHQ